MDYKGKVVWITGASSGIGEELAYQLSAKGAKVIISSNEAEELKRVKETCKGEEVFDLYLDQSDLDSLPAKAEEAMAKYGPIDILFNNGGISQRSLVVDTSLESYKRILDIDFFAHVIITKAVLPKMIERKSGHIVITSSVSGLFGVPLRSGYCAAKHALHGFFETVLYENWRDNIKVTIVCPTAVKTKISYRALDKEGKEYGKLSEHLEEGLDPDEAARRMIKAMEEGKETVVIGDDKLKWTWPMKRFAPSLFSKMIKKAKID